MPGGDGTGPAGMGSMTGRGMGWCVGNAGPGLGRMGPGVGPGLGRGRGGWGRRNWFYATGLTAWQQAGMAQTPFARPDAGSFPGPMTKEQELEALGGQAAYLADVLANIKKRIEELQEAPAR